MSIRITCSHCGERPIEEFSYGEVFEVPPEVEGETARALDRAFMFNNPEGVQREAWFHLYGCRRWIYLYRDTRTDEVIERPS